MVESRTSEDRRQLLEDFALMSQKSRTGDGDRQSDGWGAAWLDGDGKWRLLRSLSPIWKDREKFREIPETRGLVVHARSASFPEQKGKIEYNQPYIYGRYCFVFNGMLRRVKLGRVVEGEIGAQKIWTLLKELLEDYPPAGALVKLRELLETHVGEVVGLNVGLAMPGRLAALCRFGGGDDYFSLRYCSHEGLAMIASEELDSLEFRRMSNGSVVVLH